MLGAMSNPDTTNTDPTNVDADAALAAGPLEGERPWHDPTTEIFEREQARADARRAGDELVDESPDDGTANAAVSAPQNTPSAGTSVTSGHATATVTPGNLVSAEAGDQTGTGTNPTGSPAT